MEGHTEPDAAFVASIDSQIIHKIFAPGSISSLVEAMIAKTLRVHVERGYPPKVRRDALSAIHRLIATWRNDVHGFEDIFLAYNAKIALGPRSREGSLESELLGCFTGAYKENKGSKVPPELIAEVLAAGSKTYLILAEEADEAERNHISLPLAGSAPVYPLRKTVVSHHANPTTNLDEYTKCFQSVKLLKPGQRGYDPFVPKFTADTPGVIGEASEDEEPRAPKAAGAVQTNGNGVDKAVDADKVKVTSVFKPMNDTSAPSGTSAEVDGTNEMYPQRRTSTAAPPPAQPQTASRGSEALGAGTHKHPFLLYQEDEEEFVAGLLAVYRGSLTWPQVTAAANEYFIDKPIYHPKTGELVQRGQRKMEGIRQNPVFRGWKKWCARLDEQTDPQNPAVQVDWRTEYELLRARAVKEKEANESN